MSRSSSNSLMANGGIDRRCQSNGEGVSSIFAGRERISNRTGVIFPGEPRSSHIIAEPQYYPNEFSSEEQLFPNPSFQGSSHPSGQHFVSNGSQQQTLFNLQTRVQLPDGLSGEHLSINEYGNSVLSKASTLYDQLGPAPVLDVDSEL
jgi:hypothetical protein